MTITGRIAEVRWGYRPVATLGSWSFHGKARESGTFTAQITDIDEMGIDQAPLVVVVPAGERTWRWPVQDLRRVGSTCTIAVGPKE
jgi:hypothetical protein